MGLRRLVFPVSIVLTGAVLASGLVARVREENPEPSSVTTSLLAPAPLAVTMTSNIVEGRVVMGGVVTIAVEAIGPGVEQITLWDGAIPVGSTDIAGTSEGAGHTFEWAAVRPGTHLLHASAQGSNGLAHSAPMPVEVVITPLTPDLVPVAMQLPQTATEFARASGIPLKTVTGATESGQRVDASTPAEFFIVDMAAVAKASAKNLESQTSGQSEPAATDGGQATDGGKTPGPGKSPDPGKPTTPAPKLEANVDDCKVNIKVTSNTSKLTVYRANAGSVGFTQIGTIKGGATLTLENQTPGPQVYIAGPPGEPATLGPTQIQIHRNCLSKLWRGNVSLVNGVLTLTKSLDKRFWIYLSADGKPAVRIPGDQLDNFATLGRRIDIRRWLPAVNGRELHLEVWAYEVGDKTAEKMASGDAELPEGMSATDLIGESSSSWVSLEPAKLKVADTKWIASWGTPSGRVDRVVWQMTTQPLDPSSASLNPPGLVASGVAKRQGSNPAHGDGAIGTFTIPVPSYGTKGTSLVSTEPIDMSQIDSGKASNLPKPTKKLIPDPKNIDLAAMAEDPITSPDIVTSQVGNPPVVTSNTYFIRIVPLSGTTPLGAASEAVRVDLPAEAQKYPPQAPMTVTKTLFDGGHVANPDLHGCIRVNSLPPPPTAPPGASQPSSPKSLLGAMKDGLTGGSATSEGTPVSDFDRMMIADNYKTLGTYCAGDWKIVKTCKIPKIYCDAWDDFIAGATWLVSGLIQVWDMIATVYSGVITVAVVLITKMNPYCIGAAVAAETVGSIDLGSANGAAAEGVASAKDFCDKVAPAMARAAVGSLLAVFGLPPSLPTSEQLLAISEGNLVEIAVMYLKDLGVPCDQLVIDAATAAEITNGIKKVGGYVPPGVDNGVNVCRDLIKAALGGIKAKVIEMTQSQIRNSTGLPMPVTSVEGFDFEMEPRAFYRAPSLSIKATPRDSGTPFYAVCDVESSAFMVDHKTGKRIPTYSPTQMSMRMTDKASAYESTANKTWAGTVQFPIAKSSKFFNRTAEIDPLTQLVANIRSDCLTGTAGDGASGAMNNLGYDVFTSVGLPMGRWNPGDPY